MTSDQAASLALEICTSASDDVQTIQRAFSYLQQVRMQTFIRSVNLVRYFQRGFSCVVV